MTLCKNILQLKNCEMSQIHTCFTLSTLAFQRLQFNSFTRLHVSKEAHISHAVAELLSRPSSAEDKSNPVSPADYPSWENKQIHFWKGYSWGKG
jgi:hypothetical protein